jgi:hypothetical protein
VSTSSERHDPGDVTDRPDPLGDAAVLVDWDLAVLAEVHSDRLQPEVGGAGPPSDADDDRVAGHFGGVVEAYRAAVGVASDAGRADACADVHPVLHEPVADQLADAWVLAGEQVLGSFEEGHLAAEPGEHLAQLDSDGAATDHHDPPRHADTARAREHGRALVAVALVEVVHRLPSAFRCRRGTPPGRGKFAEAVPYPVRITAFIRRSRSFPVVPDVHADASRTGPARRTGPQAWSMRVQAARAAVLSAASACA